MKKLMGPPTEGPRVRIVGAGVDLFIRVNDALDAEIVSHALKMAERKRYGKIQ